MTKKFEFFPHTADIQMRVYGKTLDELFTNALIGMFQSIAPNEPGCTIKENVIHCKNLPVQQEIEITSPDVSALLVDFLSEALTLSDIHNQAYFNVTIKEINELYINGTLHGLKITSLDIMEIKAVTYHGLNVQLINGNWQADIVFDI